MWKIAKRIFFFLFIAHAIWFLVFLVRKFNEENFIVQNLRTKVIAFMLIGAALGIIYYFFFRKIKIVHLLAEWVWKLVFYGYMSSMVYLLFCTFFNPPVTVTQIANLVQGYGLKRDYVSRDNLGANMKLAVIAAEDQLFPDHDGFDLKAIKKAIKYNKRHPNKVRGASTISQQTAKNIFLWQGGGFFRKALEVFYTFTIEQLWSKKTILARYLNISETGKGIFGAEAAAKAYFNKRAKDLTRREAAMIAASLPNPKKLTVKPLSGYVSARAGAIVSQMSNLDGDADVAEIVR